MAESEKPDSSTGKVKVKSSLLDEDMSKDFLSSWKSGGDDMDFDFEPVAKGKKKAFDFGMDMDFTLDDAFAKMPSFNLDMPDIDFSTSPKKSSKSKEKKSEEESAKGSRQQKNDEFTFSFDFNGMDDFSLDEPTTKGGKNATGEKSSKQVGSSNKMDECNNLPRQPASSSEAREHATHKEIPTSEVTVFPKPGFSGEQQTSLEASFCKDPFSSNTTFSVDRQKVTQVSVEKTAVLPDLLEPVPESPMAGKTSPNISCAQAKDNDFSSVPEIKPSQMQVDSEEAHVLPQTDRIMTTQRTEVHLTVTKQDVAEVKEQVLSKPVPVVKVPAHAIASDEMEICSPNEKLNVGASEMETLQEDFATEALSTDSKTLNSDSSSTLRSIEKRSISEEEVVGVVETPVDHFNSDTVACSATNTFKTMNSEAASKAESQSSGLKDSPAPSKREPAPAKPTLTRYKLSGANNFSIVRGTNDGAETKHLMLERSKRSSTPLRVADLGDDPSSEGNVQKLDNNPTSCSKDLVEGVSAVVKGEKHADSSRDGDHNRNEDIRTTKFVDVVPCDRQAKKDGSHLLENRRLSFDAKSSGNQLPSLGAPVGVAKPGNPGYGQLKDKISSVSTVEKSNVVQVNRISSTRIDKMMPSLPSLRISRNITTNKQSSSSTVHDPKAVGNFDKSSRLQMKSKLVSPVVVQKQTASTSSLKRKPAKAADVHPSKRLSPSESRMTKVLAREVENEVQMQVTVEGSTKNMTTGNLSPKFDFHQDANMENLGFTLMVERDANVEKAEACAKELEDICNMLKKKHDEAKELLVRALVNNNRLLMLNHPICEEKIRKVQRFASRLSREQEAGV